MLNIKQRELNLKTYKYYYRGAIDGKEGVQLKSAYKQFQKEYRLTVDGIYGAKTNAKLVEVIKDLQRKLNTKGYNLTIDGMVGNATINAIKNFQYLNGLTIDRICGDMTLSKLSHTTISWDDIKYFKKSEFTCHCGCGLNNMDMNIVKTLDEIRAHFGKPIIVTCGSRCQKRNDSLKGSVKNSLHIQGKAIDFIVTGVNKYKVLEYTKSLVRQGKLRYTYTNNTNMGNAIHIDKN